MHDNGEGIFMENEMNYYYQYFNNYIDPFMKIQENIRVNYELKLEHTHRVIDNILELGMGLRLDKESLILCEIIGLFHDLGRFKQYSEYGTFSDSITGSHGELSVQLLVESQVLNRLNKVQREIITKAIRYHNYLLIPDDETQEIKLYSRLIRDADKLDAFYLETNNDEKRKYDLRNLSSERDFSNEIINDLMNSRQVDFKNIKYKFDRRLSILGLIFDLHFNESFLIVKKNNYISKIFSAITIHEELEKVKEHCIRYVSKRTAAAERFETYDTLHK